MGETPGNQGKQKVQLTLDFNPGLAKRFGSCRELVADRAHQQEQPHKAIAADMDYSPSQLSRKLTQSPNDSARFTLDDLEQFIEVTGDTQAIYYLIEKYLGGASNEIDALERRLAELKSNALQAVG